MIEVTMLEIFLNDKKADCMVILPDFGLKRDFRDQN